MTTDENKSITFEINAVRIPEKVTEDIYQDFIKPTAQAAGALIAKPFQAANWIIDRAKEYCLNNTNTQKLQEEVQLKLQNIPQEDHCEPSKSIAVPAIIANSYTDEDYLRSLYANLIANSMNKRHKGHAHPSFVEIIKQLTSEEALLLKKSNMLKFPIPSCMIRFQEPSNFPNIPHWELASANIIRMFNSGVTLFNYYMPSIQSVPAKELEIMIDNFIRLNLISCPDGKYLTDPKAYILFYKDPFNINLEAKYKSTYPDFELAHIPGYIAPTQFGTRFYDICVK